MPSPQGTDSEKSLPQDRLAQDTAEGSFGKSLLTRGMRRAVKRLVDLQNRTVQATGTRLKNMQHVQGFSPETPKKTPGTFSVFKWSAASHGWAPYSWWRLSMSFPSWKTSIVELSFSAVEQVSATPINTRSRKRIKYSVVVLSGLKTTCTMLE